MHDYFLLPDGSVDPTYYFAEPISLTSILVSIAISVALTAISTVLFGKPKPKVRTATFDSGTRTEVIRSSNEPRRVIYGEQLVSGPLVYATTTNGDDRLHLVVALAGHEVEAIDDIFINGTRVPARYLNAAGEVTEGEFFTGSSVPMVRIKKHLGSADQTADTDLIAEVSDWTTDHRLRGIAYVYLRLRGSQNLLPNGIPNVRAVVRGKKVFDPRDGVTRYTANPVLCIRDALINELDIGITAEEVNDTVNAAQATICDERVTLTTVTDQFTLEDVSDNRLILSTPEDAHKWKTGDGVTVSNDQSPADLPGGLSEGAYFYIRLDDGRFKLATTYQNALEHVAVSLDQVSPFAPGSGTHTIQLNDQVRYDCNGVFEKDQTPLKVIEEINTATAGVTIWAAGKYEIYAGAATPAVTTMTISDLRGPLEVRAKPERRELFNRVTGEFVNPDNFWQPSDFPAVENAAYVAEDGGDTLNRDIELPYTTDVTRAQRLAKIHLEKSRQGITVQVPCKLTALTVRVWDTVLVTVDYLGWSSKKFRVLAVKFAEELGGVDLTLQEEANTSYNWNFGEETLIDAAPDTNLPNPFNVGTISGLTLVSGTDQLLSIGEGSIISRIKASWTEPSTGWVDRYEIQFKKSTDADWTTAGLAQKGQTEFFVVPVEDGTSFDVRVRVISTLGSPGEFVTASNHMVVGKTAPPSAVDSFNIVRLADGTRRFSWTHDAVPADVRAGGGYVIRYKSGVTSDWDSMTALHTGLLLASPFESNELAAGTWTFAIKSVDSSNNFSTNAVFTTVQLGDPRLRGVLLQRLEHELLWPGAKTDSFVFGTQLLAATGLTIGDLPSTIGALAATIEDMIPRTDPIAYETPIIDLGANTSFTPLVTLTGTGTATVGMKIGSDADGAPVGAFEALSPQTLKRYVQFRFDAVGGASPNVALRFDTATIILDGDTQVDDFEDVNTATETAVWFESLGPGHFVVASKSGNIANITSATIRAIQGTDTPLQWLLVSKARAFGGSPARLGAEFKLFDQQGSPTNVDSVVDIELKGPKIR